MVLRAIDYFEYVAAWADVPVASRPFYRVRRVDGEWRAMIPVAVTPVMVERVREFLAANHPVLQSRLWIERALEVALCGP